ncbi:MAG: hypothetical protein A2044_08280 [Candidatus Firestonebacteria bacterium GWA2_43_8]|nr:MAG: hypothetical protein A2044_08280 [Candidatus Firestonebacteria bacterium GWA2_43_8]
MLDKNSPYPLYLQIKEKIKQDIDKDVIKDGECLPSEDELCRLYDVSKITIKRALNDLSKMNLVKRIKGKGTFVTKNMNSELKTFNQNKNIGVIFFSGNSYSPDFFKTMISMDMEILHGIEEEAKKNGYGLLFSVHDNDKGEDIMNLPVFRNTSVAGVITMGNWHGKLGIERVKDTPIVQVDFYTEETKDLPRIVFDDFNGAYAAVSYLKELGHRQIGLLTTEYESPSIKRRREGYLKALEDSNIKVVNSNIIRARGPWYHNSQEIMRPFFQKNKEITALFSTADPLAVGAIMAAEEYGIKVPDDLSVIGVGNLTEIYPLARKSLTTVKIDSQEASRSAVRLLLEDKKIKTSEIIIPVQLIVRETTAAYKGAEKHLSDIKK